ncbi:MAG: hypothetical protein ACLPX9_08035 [Rhodomicrobium sp.]
MDAKDIAEGACLACVYISGGIALKYLRNTPRLFTVMSLFAFNWALVYIYWSVKDPIAQRSIGVYTSFLTIYVGGLLAGYTNDNPAGTKTNVIDKFQIWSISFLFIVVLGKSGIASFASLFKVSFDSITRADIAASVELLLTILGFLAVWLGIKRYAGWKALTFLGFILFSYAICEMGYHIQQQNVPGRLENANLIEITPMWREVLKYNQEVYYLYLFAILKLLYTILFGGMVAYIGMNDASRYTGIWRYIGLIMKKESLEVRTAHPKV